MATSTIDRTHLLQSQLNVHVLAQANLTARMSGELVVKPASQVAKNTNNNWLHNLRHDQIPTPGQPQTPTPTPLPTQIGPFDSGYIGFSTGIPVGGNMSLALFQDGTYSFSGHFHDSGAPSYDVDAVWVIVSNSGKAFTFEVKGSTHGTFDPGSRDTNFAQNGNNQQIKDAWPDLCAGYHWRWSAYVNWNVQAAVDDVVNALKTAGTIIGAVISVVALF